MKIKKLEFENFKGIEKEIIELDNQSAVFFGNNGAGKSTVLSAAAILLSRIVENSTRKSYKKLVINTNDIMNNKQRLIINCDLSYEGKSGDLTLIKSRAKDITSNPTLKPIDNSKDIVKKLNDNLNCNNKKNVPVLVYYPVERAVLDSTLHVNDNIDMSQISIYKNCFSSGTEFKSFFEWYKAQEDLENEIRLEENLNYQDQKLRAVRAAIYGFMPGFKDLRIMRRNNKPTMTISKNNHKLSINQLSHGEKTTLAMIGDLARRLAIANPSLDNPLDGTGIVIIDEIELHLHPNWQRKILNKLYSTFKNIQFLISTHSPQVIGEVNEGKLFLMKSREVVKNENELKYEVVASEQALQFGIDTNLILSSMMNADEKNKDVKDFEAQISAKINEGDLEETRKLIKVLLEFVGKKTSSIQKLEALLVRKEYLKNAKDN